MMTLNVYNTLTEADITNGKKIAGTGTIEIDGSVRPVGGVKQKVIAVEQSSKLNKLKPLLLKTPTTLNDDFPLFNVIYINKDKYFKNIN